MINLLIGCLKRTARGVPVVKTTDEVKKYFDRRGYVMSRKVLENTLKKLLFKPYKWGCISRVSRGARIYYYIEYRKL